MRLNDTGIIQVLVFLFEIIQVLVFFLFFFVYPLNFHIFTIILMVILMVNEDETIR